MAPQSRGRQLGAGAQLRPIARLTLGQLQAGLVINNPAARLVPPARGFFTPVTDGYQGRQLAGIDLPGALDALVIVAVITRQS